MKQNSPDSVLRLQTVDEKRATHIGHGTARQTPLGVGHAHIDELQHLVGLPVYHFSFHLALCVSLQGHKSHHYS